MTGSVALDVVIGLVFVYLLYSLFATVLAEIIATYLGFRARNLLAAIDRMLTDQETLGEKVMEIKKNSHSRLLGIAKGSLKFVLDSKLFVVIIELIKRLYFLIVPYKGGLTKDFFDSAEIKYQGKAGLFRTPSYISKESFSKALLDIFKTGQGATDLERIQNYLANLNHDSVTSKYILSLLNDAQNDLQKFKILLENWFDRMMDRATGWYKRQIQFVLLVLGFVIATGFNASTFRIVKVLSKDKDARAQMVQLGSAYIQSHNPPAGNNAKIADQDKLDSLKAMQQQLGKDIATANSVLGLGWITQDSIELFCRTKLIRIRKGPCQKVVVTKVIDSCKSCKKTMRDTLKIINDTLFIKQDTQCVKKDSVKYRNKYVKNIYYSRTDHYLLIPKHVNRDLFLSNLKFFLKETSPRVRFSWSAYIWTTVKQDFLGYLITAIAISLGAPFWFDLLSKLMQLRGAVQSTTQTASGSPQKNDPSSHINREG